MTGHNDFRQQQRQQERDKEESLALLVQDCVREFFEGKSRLLVTPAPYPHDGWEISFQRGPIQ
jgi:hypothetical protein